MESLFVFQKASALHEHRNAVTDGIAAETVDGTVSGNEALRIHPPPSLSPPPGQGGAGH